jgi:hypothetical protein
MPVLSNRLEGMILKFHVEPYLNFQSISSVIRDLIQSIRDTIGYRLGQMERIEQITFSNKEPTE